MLNSCYSCIHAHIFEESYEWLANNCDIRGYMSSPKVEGCRKWESCLTCDSCIYEPPSSLDGKPCSMCDTNDPILNMHTNKP